MIISQNGIFNSGERIAVATSGGVDSMVLLDYMQKNAKAYQISVLAINVEHGIRGKDSIADTNFVKEYCKKHDIPILCYAIDTPTYAKQNGLSIEQAARQLRYQCFSDAIANGKCDKVATAHHKSDNTETVLFNLFRGTGLQGLTGISKTRLDGIIRPFINVSKADILEYAKQNDVPYVTDQTNLCTDYTRNHIRLNVIPEIKKVFPELDQSIERLSSIATLTEEYMATEVDKILILEQDVASILLPNHPALLSRAIIKALKHVGIEKDWQKIHLDSVISLADGLNGSSLTLPKGVIATREYDRITISKKVEKEKATLPFSLGVFKFANVTISITKIADKNVDLKSGLYIDLTKLPSDTVIRTKEQGDTFTKFGGGTKLLNDYLTDKKIPVRTRDNIPLLASGHEILAIFGVQISNRVRVDSDLDNIAKLEIKPC